MSVVLSDDFNAEATLDGVLFSNPLDPAFDLTCWNRHGADDL